MSPCPRKFKWELGQVKAVLIVAHNYKGVILTCCIPWKYSKRCILPELCGTPSAPCSASQVTTSSVSGPIVLKDIWRHVAKTETDLFNQWYWEIPKHPPYLQEMSSCDYNLFQNWNNPPWSISFKTREDAIKAVRWAITRHNEKGCCWWYQTPSRRVATHL